MTQEPIVTSSELFMKNKQGLKSLLDREDDIDQAWINLCKKDFMVFARGLRIAGQHGPKIFEGVMADFQRETFEDLAPSLNQLREGKMPDCRRFWIERTKKAGKDSDLAVILLWLLAFPVRPFYGQVGAADREQAAIVKERMTHLLFWNPWLSDYVELIGNELRSVKKHGKTSLAKFDIESSDVAGAHGGTPDLLVINELSHITKWEFAENLMDNADGVAQGMIIIATNAGFKGTGPEVWRNNAITSDHWSMHVLSRAAPWHSKATLADAKRRNTKSRYRRLWKGTWVSGKGDALDEDVVDRCFRLGGPTLEREPGYIYLGGLDLGISHDHSALAIVGVNVNERKVKLVYWKAWDPSDTEQGKVDLIDVEQTCLTLCLHYQAMLLYDPHQAELMSQRLGMKIAVKEMTFSSPKNLNNMASAFIDLCESQILEVYDDEEGRLRRDFGKFNIVEKAYGYRLEAVRDEFGHADVGTALVIALPAAVEILDHGSVLMQTDDDVTFVHQMDDEFTPDDVEELPDELREIYEMEGGFDDDLGYDESYRE